ncbi:MAG: sulfatase [Isosphaeraceae bacterium]
MSQTQFDPRGSDRRSAAIPDRSMLAAAILLLLGLTSTSLGSAPDQAGSAAGPNLLLIVADDHRSGTLGIEGDPRKATPNLDRLARQGIRFERAYCNAPVCTASRQSLISGKLPHAVGVTQLSTRLSDDVLTMGEWFRDLDYRTTAIGKMHFNGPSSHGFLDRIDTPDWERELRSHPPRGGDHRRRWRPFVDPAAVWLNAARHSTGLPIESMQSTYFADQALDDLKARRQDGRPFAMVVSFYDPHSPFNFPRGWRDRFRPDQFPVPPVSDRDREEQPAIFASITPDEVRGINAAYYTSIAFVDSQVGRLVQGLDDLKLSDQTLVVYIGDHGYMLGEHGRFEKHCFYEPAVRMPMILRWPGHLPGDRRFAGMVEMVDILPTVLHLLDLPVPPGMQGMDLEPLIRGKPGAIGHDFVFSEYLENEEAMVRSDRFKLIVGTGRRRRQDGYQTGRPLPGPYQRLFDELADPGETRDLGTDPRFQAVKDDLLHKMYARMVTTWEGPVPIPPGLSPLETIHWCLIPRDVRASIEKPAFP